MHTILLQPVSKATIVVMVVGWVLSSTGHSMQNSSGTDHSELFHDIESSNKLSAAEEITVCLHTSALYYLSYGQHC
jgi:hypothetical protein